VRSAYEYFPPGGWAGRWMGRETSPTNENRGKRSSTKSCRSYVEIFESDVQDVLCLSFEYRRYVQKSHTVVLRYPCRVQTLFSAADHNLVRFELRLYTAVNDLLLSFHPRGFHVTPTLGHHRSSMCVCVCVRSTRSNSESFSRYLTGD